jgi:hypothetical protein
MGRWSPGRWGGAVFDFFVEQGEGLGDALVIGALELHCDRLWGVGGGGGEAAQDGLVGGGAVLVVVVSLSARLT